MAKSKLSILIFPAWYPTTTSKRGYFAHEFAEALVDSDIDVHILLVRYRGFFRWIKDVFYPKRKDVWINSKKIQYIEVTITNFLPARLHKKILILQRNKISKKSIKATKKHFNTLNKKPDLIHIHSLCSFPFVAQEVSKKMNLPLVVTEHYSAFINSAGSIFKPFSNLKEVQEILRSSSFRFSVSEKYAKIYSNYFGINFDVFPNIISSLFERNLPEKKISNTKFTFLCIGNIAPHKGQNLLIDAFYKYKNDNITLLFIGEGKEKKSLEDKVNQLNLAHQIKFLGQRNRDEIIKHMDTANCLIVPSLYETFSLVTVESFFRGLPVIASKCGGPEELITPHKNGLLFENNSEEDLLKKMEHFIQNYATYNPNLIRENALQKYATNVSIKKLKQIYATAILDKNHTTAQ